MEQISTGEFQNHSLIYLFKQWKKELFPLLTPQNFSAALGVAGANPLAWLDAGIQTHCWNAVPPLLGRDGLRWGACSTVHTKVLPKAAGTMLLSVYIWPLPLDHL